MPKVSQPASSKRVAAGTSVDSLRRLLFVDLGLRGGTHVPSRCRRRDQRAAHGLKTADAIHAASVLSFEDPVIFVTGDPVFERFAWLNVRVVKLRSRATRSNS